MSDTAALPPELDGNSGQRVSAILGALVARGEQRSLRISDLLDALHERAFGMVILVFALPNCPPMPGIPYVSTLTGIPICLFALQMLFGMPRPWLPARIAARQLPQRRVAGIWRRIEPAFRKIERIIRPRNLALTSQTAERMLAVLILVLAVILALPLPAGNLLPAWAIALLALGLMERDGRLVAIGIVASVVALAWIAALLVAGEQLYHWLRLAVLGA